MVRRPVSVAADGGRDRGSERRVSLRYRLDRGIPSATICDAFNGYCAARVQDVSAGGIGLVCQDYFSLGKVLGIELPSPGWLRVDEVSVRVVRATRLPGGEWFLGCTFLRPLTEHELNLLRGRVTAAARPRVPG